LWLTCLFLTVPLGIVLGYGVTFIFMTFISWKWGFMVQTVLMIAPIFLLFLSIPSKYYMTANHEIDHLHDGPRSSAAVDPIGTSKIGKDLIS
jgi:hypothetical protein